MIIGRADFVHLIYHQIINILDSIEVSIPACHAGDPGSIPGRGVPIFWGGVGDSVVYKNCVDSFAANCLRESRMSFKNYKSFSKMFNYMQCLAKSYPSFIELIEIGQSYEGRPLVVLKVKVTLHLLT